MYHVTMAVTIYTYTELIENWIKHRVIERRKHQNWLRHDFRWNKADRQPKTHRILKADREAEKQPLFFCCE